MCVLLLVCSNYHVKYYKFLMVNILLFKYESFEYKNLKNDLLFSSGN